MSGVLESAGGLRKTPVPASESCTTVAHGARPRVSLALVGCGGVGRALLDLLCRDLQTFDVRLVALADSRRMHLDARGVPPERAAGLLGTSALASDTRALTAFLGQCADGVPVILDATPSQRVAAYHAAWLAKGLHVVTANKLAAVTGEPYRQTRGGVYGDAATVGAGLPVLSALRRLRAAGDRIRRVEGMLSGSLAYLFHALQAGRCFSTALREASKAGYTEPDPRDDLSGTDVARKLSIVAGAAGLGTGTSLRAEALLPERIAALSGERFWQALPAVDEAWEGRVREAHRHGRVLRYLARIEAGGRPRIGTVAVPEPDPMAATAGADNVVAIYSEAYPREPLVIRGPGAGTRVTALAMLGDVADIAAGSNQGVQAR